MKIAIIGCGKMGQEILSIFLESDVDIVWLGRSEEKRSEYEKIIRKQLKRAARKNEWSDQQLELRKSQVMLSFEKKNLKESDVVIETIVEKLEEKQNLFDEIQNIVSENCILLTNTSSLPLQQVFHAVEERRRCAGLHFFYPCKLTPAVEINYFSETEEATITSVEELMDHVEFESIRLQQEVNMLFSRLILILMSEAYNIYSENKMDYTMINQLTKENFMLMGIFDILNTTGNKIVLNCIENFIEPQNEKFYENFKELIYLIHSEYNDCSFSEYLMAVNKEEYDLPLCEEDIQKQLLRFECLYLNYMTYLVTNDYVGKEEIVRACQAILGIVKTPKEILDELGETYITHIIQEEFHSYPCEFFDSYDFSVWNS